MKIENIIKSIATFTKALDFMIARNPSMLSTALDWQSETVPSIIDFSAFLPNDSDAHHRLFKKMIDMFQWNRSYYIKGVYTPFSSEDCYKINPSKIEEAERISSEEFYEDKSLFIDTVALPELEKNVKAIDENLEISFISKRSSGNFHDEIEHPYYYLFDISELISYKRSSPRAMEFLKQFLTRLEFKQFQDNIVYFSIVKTLSVLDIVRRYAARIEASRSRAELRETYYSWNERFAFVALSFLHERYLRKLYEASLASLPP